MDTIDQLASHLFEMQIIFHGNNAIDAFRDCSRLLASLNTDFSIESQEKKGPSGC